MKSRTLLLLIIIAALVVLMFEQNAGDELIQLEQLPVAEEMPLPFVEGEFLPIADGDARHTLSVTPASLQVSSINPTGGTVSAVSFVAQPEQVGVHQRVAYGSTATWSDIRPGVWQVSATADLHFPVERGVKVADGPATELELILKPAAQVVGQVQNTYGAAMNGYFVYFLKEGESHPGSYQDKDDVVHARGGVRDGSFESPLLNPGRYLVSVGPPGRPLNLDEVYLELGELERREIEVVVESGAQLEIVVSGASQRANISLLQYDPRRVAQIKKMNERLGDKSKFQDPEKMEDKSWRAEERLKMRDSEDGKLVVNRMRAGLYCLEVKDVGGKFRSSQSFEVFADKPVRVNIAVPDWGSNYLSKAVQGTVQ